MRDQLLIVLGFISTSIIGVCGQPEQAGITIDEVTSIAVKSKCAAHDWEDRGVAPKGYIKGMALVFARAVCNPTREDVVLVSQANSGDDEKDALSWYNSNFKRAGMSNSTAGMDVVRHTYALMIGLGMRESSGQYCCGRDMSSDFSGASSAEAGLFQASWGARYAASDVLTSMFSKYKTSNTGCLVDTFKEDGGDSCEAADAVDWGKGDGRDWQATTKACPAFAAEYAAVLLRKNGGTKGEFGPLRNKATELRPECDAMLKQVQSLVTAKPALCKLL